MNLTDSKMNNVFAKITKKTPLQTGVFTKFIQNVFSAFVFRNVADKEANIGNGYVNSESLPRPYLMTIQLSATKTNNKMQSEIADFAPGAATQRTGPNICIVFDSVLCGP